MASSKTDLDSVVVERRRGSEGATSEGPERAAPVPPGGLVRRLRDVTGLRSLGTVDDLEFNLLAFFERSKTGTLNRREVNENVVTPFAFNESVALRVVKPLDLADDAHSTCLPYEKRGGVHRGPPCRHFLRLRQGTNKRPQLAVSSKAPVRKTPVGNSSLALRGCQLAGGSASEVLGAAGGVGRGRHTSCVLC